MRPAALGADRDRGCPLLRPDLRQCTHHAWAAIPKTGQSGGFSHSPPLDVTPTSITIYLENHRRLEHAQQMAGHASPRTTKLYDRTKDEITLSEVERIRL